MAPLNRIRSRTRRAVFSSPVSRASMAGAAFQSYVYIAIHVIVTVLVTGLAADPSHGNDEWEKVKVNKQDTRYSEFKLPFDDLVTAADWGSQSFYSTTPLAPRVYGDDDEKDGDDDEDGDGDDDEDGDGDKDDDDGGDDQELMFTTSNLGRSRVHGHASLVEGIRGNAILLQGRAGQYVEALGPRHRSECIGDLSKCSSGCYMDMFLKFPGSEGGWLGERRGVFLSNGGHEPRSHGMAASYDNGTLGMTFRLPSGRAWNVRGSGVLPDIWHHVAVSWSAATGLFLYFNGSLSTSAHNYTEGEEAQQDYVQHYSDFTIGGANDQIHGFNVGPLIVDEFRFSASYKRAEEVALQAIVRIYYSMDELVEDHQRQQSFLGQNHSQKDLQTSAVGSNSVQVVDSPRAKAFYLEGRGEYVVLGSVAGTCLGDLERCRYGLYLRLWLVLQTASRDPRAILATQALSLYQDGTTLIAMARTKWKFWEVAMNGVAVGRWSLLELSWERDQQRLCLYVDHAERQRCQTEFVVRYWDHPDTKMYVGRDVFLGMSSANVALDDLEIFTADRGTVAKMNNGSITQAATPTYRGAKYAATHSGQPTPAGQKVTSTQRGQRAVNAFIIGAICMITLILGVICIAIYKNKGIHCTPTGNKGAADKAKAMDDEETEPNTKDSSTLSASVTPQPPSTSVRI